MLKITVIKAAVPGDIDQGTAHEAVHRCRVEGGGQFFHIGVVISRLCKPCFEPAEGHVGKGEQSREPDAPFPCQVGPEFFFGLALINRKKGAGGVGNQKEFQAAAGDAVSCFVEFFERSKAFFPYAGAALGIGLTPVR